MERRAFRLPGFLMLLVTLVYLVAGGWLLGVLLGGMTDGRTLYNSLVLLALVVAVLVFLGLVTGFTVISPNDARVIQFFGRYVGTVRTAGYHWTVPYSAKRRISLRVANFQSERLKVSDADGNPVEIAAVVVWRVVDTAKAAFGVDNYFGYVAVQAEAAVRHIATSYPYEAHEDDRISLRNATEVSERLTAELGERVALAGVEVLESRITHLAYAPEIAQAMLARQQASAIVAARFKIVEGAVGMVSSALEKLREQNVVELDEERKAQMVANLLVVLCGDRAAQPVVNTGTLYG
ncbi:MAG TPA: SPFH domain-containing protein [Rugosimonospora sp.]|nr:SPFH domain-containing protein [Rugosimonospora sp.]